MWGSWPSFAKNIYIWELAIENPFSWDENLPQSLASFIIQDCLSQERKNQVFHEKFHGKKFFHSVFIGDQKPHW